MSSPASNLKKVRKTPLPGHTSKVPFRQPHYQEDCQSEAPLLPGDHTPYSLAPLPGDHTPYSLAPLPGDHTPYSLEDSTHKAIIDALRHQPPGGGGDGRGRGGGALVTNGRGRGSGNTDEELLVSMARRLGEVERELLLSKREVVEKSECIRQLEAKVLNLESHNEHLLARSVKGSSSHQRHDGGCGETQVSLLEKQCRALQDQVDQMEEFLNDYGMVWVGGNEGPPHGWSCDQPHQQSFGPASGSMWSPSSSLDPNQEGEGQRETPVDFDVIIKNVKELNILAGEGSSVVTRTRKGAHLKMLKPVPLTLYRNGLVLFGGPFRPYSDPSTLQVLSDLSDGYFPSELQSTYPQGVPLDITDKREVVFHSRTVTDYFPGGGRLLGGDRGPSRLVPAGAVFRTPPKPGRSDVEESSCDLPGEKLSVAQFLEKLPQSVVKKGRVLEIRRGIRDALQGDGCVPNMTLVETDVLEEMKSRLDLTEEVRPPTPSSLTTLRIKAETGEHTYVLKLKQSETIGNVRRYIDKLRRGGAPSDYILRATFPTRTLDNPEATLAQYGLFPSAIIHMATS